MDTFGVPKKINRHVIKAVYELDDQKSDSSSLRNIYNLVELSTRNNTPVANLLSAVRQSLLNLSKLGFIKMHGTKYYRCSKSLESLPHHSKKRVGSRKSEKAVLDEDKETLKPMNKKRRRQSEDSLTDYLPGSSKKSLRRKKIKQVHLPKARQHTGYQLNLSVGETEQDWGSSSDEDIENKSEDENANTTISSSFDSKPHFQSEMFGIEMNEETGFDKISENSKNSLQSFEDNDQKIQDNELNNVDDQISKIDVSNENESELNKTTNNEETESIASNSKEVANNVSNSNHSQSTEQPSKHSLKTV